MLPIINRVFATDPIGADEFNLTIITDVDPNLTIQSIAAKIANFLLTLAAIAAVIYLIYSGILYLTAAGNEANADKGKKGIINAIIGIIVIVTAFVILRVTNRTVIQAINNT